MEQYNQQQFAQSPLQFSQQQFTSQPPPQQQLFNMVAPPPQAQLPTFAPIPKDGKKYIPMSDNGIDYNFKLMNPETDVILGNPEKRDLPPEAETVGSYHTIPLTRRYPDTSTGPNTFDGPREWGSLLDPVASAAKKKAKKGEPIKVRAVNPDAKPKGPRRSIISKLKKDDADHKEYIEFWRKMYISCLRKLSAEEIRLRVGLRSLDPDMIKWELLSHEKPNGSFSYPVHYPEDENGHFIKGASPSVFYKVNIPSPGASDYFATKFMLPGNPPRLISYTDIEKFDFEYYGQYNVYAIIINGSGPTASFQISCSGIVITDCKPKGNTTTMTKTIFNVLGNNPDILHKLDSQILSIQNAQNPQPVSAQSTQDQEKKETTSTSSGIPLITTTGYVPPAAYVPPSTPSYTQPSAPINIRDVNSGTVDMNSPNSAFDGSNVSFLS